MIKGLRRATSEPGYALEGAIPARSGSAGGGGSMRGFQAGSLSELVLQDEYQDVASHEEDGSRPITVSTSAPRTESPMQKAAGKGEDDGGGGEREVSGFLDRGGSTLHGQSERLNSSRVSGRGSGGHTRLGTGAGSEAESQRSYQSQGSGHSSQRTEDGWSGMRPVTHGSNRSKRSGQGDGSDGRDGAVVLPPINSHHHR